MYTGRCLCGGVQFRIDGELAPIQVCHCTQCRQAQGTPFATNIPVEASAFTLISGPELLSDYVSSPGKHRVFCRRCGSPVYSFRDALPATLRIRAGLLVEPLNTRPAFHFYTASQCNWWPIQDTLPQYPDAYVPSDPR
ncbi:GFA family protein [Sinimarinibacterium sp. CAU 1509]|uniref:GFA family protein n=1 Tax=Sinimarinibacterium sp. CAU 1509 TaxID=2562283 RepID=UPI0010ACF317|nr:GFA family protein [Sinimarinibacterium sp. CAU 1509]TJY55177.1 GFA family protein [Sinimarinibacterium sp. CAU 1509]